MSFQRYLKRMDGSIEDKIQVVQLIPENAEYILDVGCAAGGVTAQLAMQLPDSHFHGIDVSLPFIGMAQTNKNLQDNVSFSHNWLSDLHQYGTKYDCIMFMSVLHEIFSYGQGSSSIVKVLADAYELLKPGGRIIIRDMLRETNQTTGNELMGLIHLRDKLLSLDKYREYVIEYEQVRQEQVSNNVALANDFLLHTLYLDNWQNEIKEFYTCWDIRAYGKYLGDILNMELVSGHTYLLDYVKGVWKKELWLNDEEIHPFISTGVVCAER